MIPLYEKHYFVYTRMITSPAVQRVTCALCSRTKGRYGRAVHVRGWACLKINHRVRERYCPTCTRKIWPGFYAKALEVMGGH